MEMSQHHLKHRSDIHLARKIWHFVGVLTILVIYHNVSRPMALQLITFVASVFIVFDVLRGFYPSINQALMSVFQPIMREHERHSLAGTTYLLTGAFVVIFLFPKSIVTMTLLFLSMADPLAAYVGVLYGRDKIVGQKSLQGFMAALGCCTGIAATYYLTHNMMTDRILIVSILSGLVGAVAELIPVGKLDDNLTFPVITAVSLWLIFHLFGGF